MMPRMETKDLLKTILKFCKAAGIAPSLFGRSAVGDPNLVNDLKNGRSLTMKTLAKVERYMKMWGK